MATPTIRLLDARLFRRIEYRSTVNSNRSTNIQQRSAYLYSAVYVDAFAEQSAWVWTHGQEVPLPAK